MSDLLALLEVHAHELSERVYQEMIADPFWLARYGDRAKVNMRQDSVFHLRYLREAMSAGSPEVLVNYTKWLQELLLSRGMCSLHIAENYDRLARAIEERWPGAAAPAVELLEAGKRALLPEGGPAAALVRGSEAVVDAASDRVEPETILELRHLVSYLADALAFGHHDRFAAHGRWLDGFLGRGRVATMLAALDPAIASHAPAAHEAVRAMLDELGPVPFS